MSNVNLLYDFTTLGGDKTETPRKKASLSFKDLLRDDPNNLSTGENAVYVAAKGVAYFRIDSSEMLDFIVNYFSGKETTVLVLPISAGTPNTSPLASQGSSRNVEDPYSLEPIADLKAMSVVKVVSPDGNVQISVEADGLVKYLEMAKRGGKSVFDVKIDASDESDGSISIDLKEHEMWLKCLCRGHQEAKSMRTLFMQGIVAIENHRTALRELGKKAVWDGVLFFYRDLLLAQNGAGAQQRMEAAGLDSTQAFYFTSIHFGNDLPYIMNFPGPTGEKLLDVLRNKYDQGGEICAAHSLGPLIQRFFNLPYKYWTRETFQTKYKAFEKTWVKQQKKGGQKV